MMQKIEYEDLNSRQKEQFNFQKFSGVLADYGFRTIPLSDDWNGADFIAYHVDNKTFLKVQLKGRATFAQKYIGKELWIAFRAKDEFYLFPHDEVLKQLRASGRMTGTISWDKRGGYSFNYLPKKMRELLAPFKI